jgi:hypothetical protein
MYGLKHVSVQKFLPEQEARHCKDVDAWHIQRCFMLHKNLEVSKEK